MTNCCSIGGKLGDRRADSTSASRPRAPERSGRPTRRHLGPDEPCTRLAWTVKFGGHLFQPREAEALALKVVERALDFGNADDLAEIYQRARQ